MLRKETSRAPAPNETVTDTKQETQATTNTTAKVTLVKPVPEEASAQLSLARPKVGRLPALTTPADNKDEALFTPQQVLPEGHHKNEADTETHHPMADMAPVRPWDFKFALVLVTLFVAVNLGLIMLLHTKHAAVPVAAQDDSNGHIIAERTSPRPTIAPLATPPAAAEQVPVPPAASAPVASPPALPAMPTEPAVAAEPVSAAPVAIAPVTVAAAPPAAAVTPDPTPPAAEQSSGQQELLSIISKD